MDGLIAAGVAEVRKIAVHTLDRRPDLIGSADTLMTTAWSRFMFEDDVAWSGWGELNRRFPSFQFVMCAEDDKVIAVGNTIPLAWDRTLAGPPSGFDGALLDGIAGHRLGQPPTALSALGATIDPAYQGQGVSRLLLGAMRDLAARNGFADLIAPVRPSHKSRYPLIPMERYIRWRHAAEDDAPFGPWLRTHWRLGAHVL